MKLGPREAPGYFARPDPRRALLIYGQDAMRVALRRHEAVAALTGPQGEADMRIARIDGGELRRDPAALLDSVKAVSFFPGPRAVVVEDAPDAVADAVAAALEDWREGDGTIVVTAGNLRPASALRKLFEGHATAYAAAIYDDPPSREEVEAMLRRLGLGAVGTDGMAAILDLSRALDPGDFRQNLEKLALYKHGDPAPVGPEDVAAIAPVTLEADLDDLVLATAEAKLEAIGPLMRRIEGQGIGAVAVCIALTRHFRALLTAAADPGGPAAGVGKLRPPAFGPRRDRLVRQAGAWGRPKLEQALGLLTDTDLSLRSATRAPDMAVVERAMIRLATLGRGRG
jgi:DNA polymerase-3 subunit delta